MALAVDQQISVGNAGGAVRLAGCRAAAVGGGCAAIGALLHGFGSDRGRDELGWRLLSAHMLQLPALLAAAVVAVALAAGVAERRRPPVGAATAALVGTILWSCGVFSASLAVHTVARLSPAMADRYATFDDPAAAAFAAVATVTLFGGWAWLTAAAVRAGILTRTAAFLLVVGLVGCLVATPVGGLLLAGGLGWTAVSLGGHGATTQASGLEGSGR